MSRRRRETRCRHVEPGYQELHTIANALFSAKRIVVIAGAGISTAAGIPDFRSKGGTYAKGILFEEAACHDERRPLLLKTALRYRDLASSAEPTETHKWLTSIKSRLLRCYTQNIDWLEAKAGLETGIGRRFKCVPLHGSNAQLKCGACHEPHEWQDHRHDIESYDAKTHDTLNLHLPCTRCTSIFNAKQHTKSRGHGVGQLRPSMVMYDEVHPQGEEILELAVRDALRGPDLLLVLGTSLKVDGPKKLLEHFAPVVRRQGGKVIYVNLSGPPSSCSGKIDYWVDWYVDEWARDLKRRQDRSRMGARRHRARKRRRRSQLSTSNLTAASISPPPKIAVAPITLPNTGAAEPASREADSNRRMLTLEDGLRQFEEIIEDETDWEFPPFEALGVLDKVRQNGESYEDVLLRLWKLKHADQPGYSLGVDQDVMCT